MKYTIIGHRGSGSGLGSSGLLENTIASMEKAIQDGAHEIECDLAITKDGRIIFFHDLSPSKGKNRTPVQEMTLAEVEAVAGEISLLEDGLKRVGASRLVLEIKSYSDWRGILDRIDGMIDDPGRLNFISFMPKALREIKKRWPAARCNFIATCLDDRFEPFALRRHVDLCKAESFEEVSGHILLFPRRICDYAFDRGLDVGLGMIDNVLYLKKCQRSGVRRLYSNNVAWLNAELRQSEQ